MSNQQSAVTRFGGVTPIISVGDVSASLEYYTRILGFNNDWEAWMVSPQSRAIAAICFCPRATRDIPAVGYSSASGTSTLSLRNIKRKERRFDIPQLITSGLARCRSKTRTETYSGLARIRKGMNRLESGSTCAGVAGSNRPKADGRK